MQDWRVQCNFPSIIFLSMLCIFMCPFYVICCVNAFISLYGTPWAYYYGESARCKCPDYGNTYDEINNLLEEK